MNLREIKRQVSPKVLRIPGVAGIGIPRGTLTVYLAEDSPKTKRTVANVIRSLGLGISISYVVTGEFKFQH